MLSIEDLSLPVTRSRLSLRYFETSSVRRERTSSRF
jgi:hypothetical protein